MKIFSILQPGPLLANKPPHAKFLKGVAFLLGSFLVRQAVYRLDSRPDSLPGPVLLLSEQPIHPYVTTLLNPSHRESLAPDICSLEFWAPLPP